MNFKTWKEVVEVCHDWCPNPTRNVTGPNGSRIKLAFIEAFQNLVQSGWPAVDNVVAGHMCNIKLCPCFFFPYLTLNAHKFNAYLLAAVQRRYFQFLRWGH